MFLINERKPAQDLLSWLNCSHCFKTLQSQSLPVKTKQNTTPGKEKKPTNCQVFAMGVLQRVEDLHSILPPSIITCKILRPSRKETLRGCWEENKWKLHLLPPRSQICSSSGHEAFPLGHAVNPIQSIAEVLFLVGCFSYCVHWQHLKQEENMHAIQKPLNQMEAKYLTTA